jgi:TPR repeat protein
MLGRTLLLAAGTLALMAPAMAGDTSFLIDALNSRQLYLTGIHFRETGRTAEAVKVYEDAIRKDVDGKWKGKSYYALAQIYLSPGSFRSTPRGIASLAQAALAGNGDATGDLIDMQLDKNVRPPNLKALIPLYSQRARESSNSAALLLAKLTAEGQLGRKPATSSTDWYTIAAERGSNTAVRKLVVVYAAEGNQAKALAWIKRLGKSDAASVYLDLAKDFLTDGDELKRNGDAAVIWYRLALAADPEKAVHSATQFFETGSDSDRQAILAAVRKIADRGDPDASLFVAKLLDKSDPTAINREAIRYYATAAKGGNGDAVTGLVRVSAFLKPDDTMTSDLMTGITAAAGTGNVDAMLALANFYSMGTLVARDVGQGFGWYLKAAKAGNAEAEFRAGVAYAQGLGTGTDLKQARHWLTAAEGQGYPLAAPSLQALGAID